jgi:hypothetical protein
MKTHCKYGHELSGDNLYLSPKGLRGCRQCRSKYAIASHSKNPVARKRYAREWKRKTQKENPRRLLNYHYVHDYGITIEDRDAKLSQQKNLCMICKRLMDDPCLDHDHETKQIRDLLCKNCNCALGLLQDDTLIVASALDYLKKWKSNASTE